MLFIAVVEIQREVEQPVAELCQLPVERGGGGEIAVHERPCRFDRVDDEQVAHFAAAVQDHAEPGEVIFEMPQHLRKVRMPGEGGRIIPFRFSGHRIERKMQTAHVDAERILPVSHRLVAGEAHVPAGAAVNFADAARAVELPGRARQLLAGVIQLRIFGQLVDARNLHVRVVAHRSADTAGLGRRRILPEQMSGQRDVVPAAPCADLL